MNDEDEELARLLGIIRGLADGVLMLKLRLQELSNRVAELEHQQVTNAVGTMYHQRDILE